MKHFNNERPPVGAMIKMINTNYEKRVNQNMKVKDLTASQARLLLLFETEQRPYSMKELENRLHISQPTVVGLVIRCEQKGFVRTYPSQTDKRVKMVELTEKGQQLNEEVKSSFREMEGNILNGLSPDEKNTLKELLEKVCNHLADNGFCHCGKEEEV